MPPAAPPRAPFGAPIGDPAETPLEVAPTAPGAPDPWGGLPPRGTKPVGDRYRFLLEIVGVYLVWFCIWLTFRYSTSDFARRNSDLFDLVDMVLAPTLTLLPPIIWWQWRRKERGLPFLFTRRNLFSSVSMAALAAIAFAVVANVSYPLLLMMVGVKGGGGLHVFAPWRGQTMAWLVTQTFLFMVIVGPVEELFNRGFIMDQTNRAFRPYVGIALSSVLFVLGHVPIDFLVYRVDLWGWAGRWASSLPFALGIAVYYQWSRNIWGPAVYHGLYDWFLGIFYIDYVTTPSLSNALGLGVLAIVSVFEFLILVGFGYVGYRLWWKGSRPAGSLGFGARATALRSSVGRTLAGLWARVRGSGVVRFTRDIDRSPGPMRQALSLAVVAVVLLGTLGVTGAVGLVPGGGGGGGGGAGPGGGETGVLTFNESDYDYEGDTVNYTLGEAPMQVVGLDAKLTWTDEPAFSRRYTNMPDTFRVELAMPDGTTLVAQEGDTGVLTASWTAEKPVLMETVLAKVTAVTCGDQVPIVNLLGQRVKVDSGNAYLLTVEVKLSTG